MTFILLDNGEMAGDVNLYLHDDDAEIEVMVAEKASRRKGLARDALQLMMCYANQQIGARVFVAKILQDNVPSVRLFEGLGFSLLRKLEVFGEVHLVKDVGANSESVAETKNRWRVGRYSEDALSKMKYPVK